MNIIVAVLSRTKLLLCQSVTSHDTLSTSVKSGAHTWMNNPWTTSP